MCVRALQTVINSVECRTKGWVLDGFPATVEQARMMRDVGIIPHQSMFLDMGNNASSLLRARLQNVQANLKKRMNDEPKLPKSPAQLQADLNNYESDVIDLQAHFQRNFDNVRVVNATASPWVVRGQAVRLVRRTHQSRSQYFHNVRQGRVAPVESMCVTKKQLKKRYGDFQKFCPVCWVKKSALVRKHDPQFTTEFRGRYYFLCSADCYRDFSADPKFYINDRHLPAHLPYRLAPQDRERLDERHFQLRGFCPVSLKRAMEARLTGGFILVAGQDSCGVVYKSRVYLLASETELNEFMMYPSKYSEIRLPAKMSVPIPQISPAELLGSGKFVGFLEQTVSTQLIEALTEFGNNRLKHPSMTTSQTAFIFLGLLLKAYNKNNRDFIQEKWMKRLQLYISDCLLRNNVEPRPDVGAMGDRPNEAALRYDMLSRSSLEQVRSLYWM
eukprot:TRINITY_DN10497_c0_g1_i4.p1 TRINITY_DN10497_c0_g1~~TRINITY_DN10497_c0_g1_i4.p1  ORF type:complete len:444 (-),score=54.63 TRINITY_DN10497_c0_g1_i4:56-1387(-)